MSGISGDDDDYVPLVDQRVFGAGIKRKRIAFVPATTLPQEPASQQPMTKQNVGDRYLSIVLQKKNNDTAADMSLVSDTRAKSQQNQTRIQPELPTPICAVCGQSISGDGEKMLHESSVAHQVCLQHSHPPSHLDRSHIGLKYLQNYGWDPDARTGLGARSEGIRIPVKARLKNDTAGLDVSHDGEDKVARIKKLTREVETSANPVKLNAKEVRISEAEKSKRAERLRRDIYGEDLSQYLGVND